METDPGILLASNWDNVVVFQYEEMPEIQEYFSRQIEIMKQQATVFDLGSCLIKPVQRVLKYPLLLNELIQVQPSALSTKFSHFVLQINFFRWKQTVLSNPKEENSMACATANAFLPSANEVCEGYVFTHVCHSVHGGGLSSGPYPGVRLRGLARGGLLAHTQGWGWGVWLGGGESPGPYPGGEVGGLARGVQAQVRGVSQHALRRIPPPADGYCCRWYASYLNAFLCMSLILSSGQK